MALMEEAKNMPASAVWDYYCMSSDVPVGAAWLEDVRKYEKKVSSKR
jgi:L-rhamnose isomerase